MKNIINKKINRKRLAIAAVFFVLLVSVPITVTAWFSNQRSMITITKIQSPAAINIGAGNKENCTYIDMAGIDVSNPDITSKEFVFCVYSAASNESKYKLQLAHTTNIPFTYEIYKAKPLDENGESVDSKVVYHSQLTEKDY